MLNSTWPALTVQLKPKIMSKYEKIENVHMSIVNGQNKQAYNQMKEYGLYDFFDDYAAYLVPDYSGSYITVLERFESLRKAINIFMRLEHR